MINYFSNSWSAYASISAAASVLSILSVALNAGKEYTVILCLLSLATFLKSFFQLKREVELNENVSIEMAKELFWQANHDSDTGILNIRAIQKEIDKCISEPESPKFTHAVVRLDIDNYVLIKKSFGAEAVLSFKKQVVEIINPAIHQSMIMAIAGERGFAILWPYTEISKIREFINSLLDETRSKEFIWQQKELPIAVSIGWTTIDQHTANPNNAVNHAEVACIRASQQGGNSAVLYRKPNTRDLNEIDIVTKINRALKNDTFMLYQQGIYPISSSLEKTENSANFVEVLIRMQDKEIIMSPSLFLPIAEKFNLMADVDKWVIKNTFEFISKNVNDHTINDRIYSINLSGDSLNNDEIFDFTSKTLAKYNINPEQICFEITESVAIENLHHTAYLVGYLKRLGCLVALDDFGTGVSSFEYLKYLPIDILKLDGAFVKSMTEDKIDYEITKAISTICKALDIKLIAEFVENKETLKKLNHLEIDYAQGYFLDKPTALVQ